MADNKPPVNEPTKIDPVTLRVVLTQEQVDAQFVALLDRFAKTVYDLNVKNGFWEAPNKGEKIALIHSELSESLENIRHGTTPDDKIPQFTGEIAELADAVIRILDYCKHYELPLGDAIIAKHNYNLTRPFKHGKNF
jgi:hypothetical protein